MRKRIIIAGSRGFSDYEMMSETIIQYCKDKDLLPSDVEIIEGGAKGADDYGKRFALKYKLIKHTQMPADWSIGKQAGYIRNCDMADYAHQFDGGVLFAFWDGKSKGTNHMINIAKRKGMEVHVIKYPTYNTNCCFKN